MWRAIIGGSLLVAGPVTVGGAAAAPPPTPPAFIDGLAYILVATPTAASFDRLAAIVADDIVVRQDGRRVVAGKQAWLAAERRRLGKVDRMVVTYAEGFDAVLVVDRVDDRSDLPDAPGLLFDPRYVTRATRYAIGADHLVHTIDTIQADGVPRAP